MAENTLEATPIFNLGIEDSAQYGSLAEAEAFLTGTETITPAEKKVENPIKKVVKKEEEKEEEDVANKFLGEDEEEEEEEEEKPKDKKSVKDAMDGEEESDLAPLTIISNDLFKAGVFSIEDGEDQPTIETPDDFLAQLQKEGKKNATAWLEGYLGRFDENNNDLFEAIFVNGVPARDYLPAYSDMIDLEGMNLEVESNQEKIVRYSLEQSGFSAAQIDKKIEKLKSFAALEEEAKDIHPILLQTKKDELKQKSEAEARKQDQKIKADTDYRSSLSTILNQKLVDKNIGGIPLTQKDATEIFDFLSTKKWKTATGELLTDFDKYILDTRNPENHEDRIKIALLRKNKFNFSKITKTEISKESNSLFSGLKKDKEKKSQPAKNTVWQ